MNRTTADIIKQYVSEAKGILEEVYGFSSTSPKGQQGINAVIDLLDDIDRAIESTRAIENSQEKVWPRKI